MRTALPHFVIGWHGVRGRVAENVMPWPKRCLEISQRQGRMKKCFIHIGMEKAGSTSIQEFLKENMKALRNVGVVYPSAKGASLNHNFLASAYIPLDSDRLSRGVRSKLSADQQADRLRDVRESIMEKICRGGHVVLSGEHLFRLTVDEIAEFKRDLEQAGVRQFLVFGILRSPASFYLSFIQQDLKGSSAYPSPDEFFVPYGARVAAWQKHFDCDFCEFGTLTGSKEGIVGTFARKLGAFLQIDLTSLRATIPHANESLSPEEMQIVQDFRKAWYPEDDGKLNRPTKRLVHALTRLRDPSWRKPILRPEVVSKVEQRHRSEILELAARTGIAFPIVGAGVPAATLKAEVVSDVVANFDQGLYERLSARLRPYAYLNIGARLAHSLQSMKERLWASP